MSDQFLSGILYAEDFDLPEPTPTAPETAAPPPVIVVEPTFSLADLRRAADHAQLEGRSLERQDADLREHARRSDALTRIAEALDSAGNAASRGATEAASATAETLLTMVAAVLPAFAARHASVEVGALLDMLLPAMRHEPHLVIRVHSSLVDGLRDATAALLDDGPVAVEWVTSDSMLPGDITVRWQDGMMQRDTRALCARVRALIMPGSTMADTTEETHDGY